MHVTFEACISSVILLLTLAFTLCQGQECQLSDTPHPKGLCGERLTQAHANLCFLLHQNYPVHFAPNGKRAQPPAPFYPLSRVQGGSDEANSRVRRELSPLERIYNIPLSVLARIHLTDDNWRSFVYKRDMPGEASDEFQLTEGDLDELRELTGSPSRMLIRMLSKRSSVQKRSRGVFCECCVNRCGARQLALYC